MTLSRRFLAGSRKPAPRESTLCQGLSVFGGTISPIGSLVDLGVCLARPAKRRFAKRKLSQDVRYAVRTLIKTPGVTLAVIISIGLGIAANTTVFSIAEGLLRGVLPVRDSQRLVSFPDSGETFSYPDYVDYPDRTADVLEGGVCAYFAFVPAGIGGRGGRGTVPTKGEIHVHNPCRLAEPGLGCKAYCNTLDSDGMRQPSPLGRGSTAIGARIDSRSSSGARPRDPIGR